MRLVVDGSAAVKWLVAEHDSEAARDLAAMLAAVPDMPVRWGANEAVSADAVRIALALDRPVYD